MPDRDQEDPRLIEVRRLAKTAFSEEQRRYSAETKRHRRQLRDKIHAFEDHFDQLDRQARDAVVSAFRNHGFELDDQSFLMILNYAHVYFREREGSKTLNPHTAATRILLNYWRKYVRPPSQPETVALYDVFGEPTAPSAPVRWVGDELLLLDCALIEKGGFGAGHWRAAYTVLTSLRKSNDMCRSDARLPD